jgi:hypothetical protein
MHHRENRGERDLNRGWWRWSGGDESIAVIRENCNLMTRKKKKKKEDYLLGPVRNSHSQAPPTRNLLSSVFSKMLPQLIGKNK